VFIYHEPITRAKITGILSRKGQILWSTEENIAIRDAFEGMYAYYSHSHDEIGLIDSLGNLIDIGLTQEAKLKSWEILSRSNPKHIFRFSKGVALFFIQEENNSPYRFAYPGGAHYRI
jgi:hypothetical protein